MSFLVFRRYAWASSLLLLCLFPVAGKSSVDHTADQILGYWLFPAKGSSIELYRSGDRYYGRIADVSSVGKDKFGLSKNQLLISDLVFDGNGWSGGELIHPKTGSHFDVEVKMIDSQTLTATVFKGCRWLNKEFILTRKPTS
ncbi:MULTISPECIES: DUF2147 domain-containing protein [Spirosoma]|uniref:DUF2147 domain-containing protein n=1 Tax=Spirosoma liriopis TaxID=2937440 RepID=A0ABT0HGC6_9BACT|nr:MULTISPECIES: DUF2147 domain-containing protein [Spirosoma]MCK8491209.1 DUF2147 domain-containing protein [Spirosoma liriopis]UHG90586.1 DUF2147 domain-containing protein [Spirosoma oryzicola]